MPDTLASCASLTWRGATRPLTVISVASLPSGSDAENSAQRSNMQQQALNMSDNRRSEQGLGPVLCPEHMVSTHDVLCNSGNSGARFDYE